MPDKKYANETAKAQIESFLHETIGNMSLDLTVSVADASPDRHHDFETPELVVEFKGADTGMLLENKAELLLALEHLTMEMLRMPAEDHSLICFDADDWRRLRIEELRMQAMEAAERVNKSAGALRDNAGQMAGTAKHQADESVRTLSAVEQLAASMRQVAETAGASSESARQVLQATERGRVAVQETVQDMQSIRAAVQRMSKQVKALGDRHLHGDPKLPSRAHTRIALRKALEPRSDRDGRRHVRQSRHNAWRLPLGGLARHWPRNRRRAFRNHVPFKLQELRGGQIPSLGSVRRPRHQPRDLFEDRARLPGKVLVGGPPGEAHKRARGRPGGRRSGLVEEVFANRHEGLVSFPREREPGNVLGAKARPQTKNDVPRVPGPLAIGFRIRLGQVEKRVGKIGLVLQKRRDLPRPFLPTS